MNSDKAILILLLATAHAGFSQGFSFTKIADEKTPRPDGGIFSNPHGVSTDGRYVVWDEQGTGVSMWSADLQNSLSLTKLVDMNAAAPGGTGNFVQLGQIGGGPYSNFNVIVRSGVAVFVGSDSKGQGLYSVPATGGAITRIADYNTALPNGSKLGVGGNTFYAFGLNDTGFVVFSGTATGVPNASVYTAKVDGSALSLVDDHNHRFINTEQQPGPINSCVQFFGTPAIGGNHVVWGGSSGGTHYAIYSMPIGDTPQGLPIETCGNAPAGPLVLDSRTPLPNDPKNGIPDWDFIQTDGQAVYFHGSDSFGCCSSTAGFFSGIFAVPIGGGSITKIVANGDTLPVIGTVTRTETDFSVDAGGVVFEAWNENANPTQRGIFLYSGGKISKIFASGDTLNGATLTQNGTLEVWPQSYKNGVIAFEWLGAVFVAEATQPPAIGPGGVVSASGYGGFSSAAPGSWIEIKGSNLAPTARTWTGADFQGNSAPTALDDVSVTVGGRPAYIYYISSTQINAQIPSSVPPGAQQVVVRVGEVTTPPFTLTVNAVQPGLLAPPSFLLNGKQNAVATFPDQFYVLPPGAISGVASRRAKPGDTIILYGIGFGPVTPDTPAGQIATELTKTNAPVQFLIGGVPVTPSYAGLAPNYVGLYQFNLVVPNVPPNDATPVTFTLGGAAGTQSLVLAVGN